MAKKKSSKSSAKSAAAAKSPARKSSETFLVSHSPAPTESAKPVATAHTPTAADVSARAHQIWIARGKPSPGTPLADWLQAERELGVRKS